MTDFDPGINPYGSFMSGPSVPEGTTARAGAKLETGVTLASDEAIVEALRTVHDPETVSYTHLTLPTILLV